ncbi:MAG: PLP-dependent aminotransferase family protein [Dehalococcoidales bacterium]
MDSIFSDRISDVPRSFIREILKVTLDPTIISFAGGLPNRKFFPVEELKAATAKVFDTMGRDVLQYSTSEGFSGLREMIARRYHDRQNLDIPIENILITNGSQQGLDLMGKTFINEGDDIVIEEPAYLGAIQAFSLYKPRFNPVVLTDEGMDLRHFKAVMSARKPKLIYVVPNFQNPSGLSFSERTRREMAGIIRGTKTLLIEDDPYGDLRYSGSIKSSFKTVLPDNTILFGTFSKTVAPGFRLGWVVAPDDIMEKLIVAKQAADLHTTHFTQCILWQYMKDNDLDAHIRKIKECYGRQMKTMLHSIEKYFPDNVAHTTPEGGMFLWVTLPENTSSRDLLDLALKDKVIFVPGDPFYVNRRNTNTLRLNFSCTDEETIEIGIINLGKAMKQLLAK